MAAPTCIAAAPASRPRGRAENPRMTSEQHRWVLWCSLGLCFCFVLFGEGTAISGLGVSSTFSVVTDANALSGGWGIIAGFLAAALIPGPMGRLSGSKAALVAVGLAAVVGVVLLTARPLGLVAGVPAAAEAAGGIVLGAAATVLLVGWADLVIPLGARNSSACLALALLETVVFDMLVQALVEAALLPVFIVLCVASPLLLALSARRRDAAPADDPDRAYRGVVPVWVPFVTIALFGALTGLVQSGVVPAMAQGGASLGRGGGGLLVPYANELGILVMVAAVAVGLRFLKGNDLAFYRWSVLGVLAVVMYLSAVLPADLGLAVTVLMTVARMLLFAYAWTLFSTPARSASPVRLFAVGWLLFLLFNTTLTRVGLLAVEGPLPLLPPAVALAAMLGALFVVEFAATSVPARCGDDGLARPTEEDRLADPELVASLARAYGLTRREEEVLALLVQGKSREFVANALVISSETVRTHTQHVYQKLGVHSREELRAKALAGAGGN